MRAAWWNNGGSQMPGAGKPGGRIEAAGVTGKIGRRQVLLRRETSSPQKGRKQHWKAQILAPRSFLAGRIWGSWRTVGVRAIGWLPYRMLWG